MDPDWLLRAAAAGAVLELVRHPDPLVVWHVETNRARITNRRDWRYSLAWASENRTLFTRRGYAAFLHCPDCGEVWQCRRCTISLTVHRAPPGLRCHYCGYEEPLPLTCRKCASPVQQMRGVGTQQLEQVLSERYPGARVARMDLDTTSTKWSHQRILGTVERGEVDLLIGTQMIAKGLDFPNVTLVGVINADTALHFPDFRAAERTFQLVTQVAGRTGRGERGGPEGPPLQRDTWPAGRT